MPSALTAAATERVASLAFEKISALCEELHVDVPPRRAAPRRAARPRTCAATVDYVAMPLSLNDFLARLRGLGMRGAIDMPSVLTAGDRRLR
jgi:hypothetical protein